MYPVKPGETERPIVRCNFYTIKCVSTKMKWTNLYLLFIIFVAIGCNEPEDSCFADDPLNQLDWLNEEIEDLKSNEELSQFQYVSKAEYEGGTVFLFGNCCPYCNTATPVKNCFGQQIGFIGSQESAIDISKLENIETVWKPEDSACDK